MGSSTVSSRDRALHGHVNPILAQSARARSTKHIFLFGGLALLFLPMFVQAVTMLLHPPSIASLGGSLILVTITGIGLVGASIVARWSFISILSDEEEADWSLLFLAGVLPLALLFARFFPLPTSDDSKVTAQHASHGPCMHHATSNAAAQRQNLAIGTCCTCSSFMHSEQNDPPFIPTVLSTLGPCDLALFTPACPRLQSVPLPPYPFCIVPSQVNCLVTLAFLLRLGSLMDMPPAHSLAQFLLSFPLFT